MVHCYEANPLAIAGFPHKGSVMQKTAHVMTSSCSMGVSLEHLQAQILKNIYHAVRGGRSKCSSMICNSLESVNLFHNRPVNINSLTNHLHSCNQQHSQCKEYLTVCLTTHIFFYLVLTKNTWIIWIAEGEAVTLAHTCQITLDISGSSIDFQRGPRKYPG